VVILAAQVHHRVGVAILDHDVGLGLGQQRASRPDVRARRLGGEVQRVGVHVSAGQQPLQAALDLDRRAGVGAAEQRPQPGLCQVPGGLRLAEGLLAAQAVQADAVEIHLGLAAGLDRPFQGVFGAAEGFEILTGQSDQRLRLQHVEVGDDHLLDAQAQRLGVIHSDTSTPIRALARLAAIFPNRHQSMG